MSTFLGGVRAITLGVLALNLTGCWAVAAGVGTEAGYVVAQEDRTMKETLDDQALVTSVKTQLLADSEVSGLDINVDSFKSVITLKGVVGSSAEADKAIKIAKNTNGVKGVVSKLYVE